MAKTGVKLYPPEIEAVDELRRQLRAIYGTKASRAEVLGALAHGISVHQLFGILLESQRHEEWNADRSESASEAEG
jgi:hypothetical protein